MKKTTLLCALVMGSIAACGGSSGATDAATDTGAAATHWPIVATSEPLMGDAGGCPSLSHGRWSATGSCGAALCTIPGTSDTCASTWTCGTDSWPISASPFGTGLLINGGGCTLSGTETSVTGTCTAGAAHCDFAATYLGP